MTDILENRVERLKGVSLPLVQGHRSAVQHQFDHVRGSTASLAAIVNRDPGLALRLYRRLNEVRSPDAEIPKVQHALGLVGIGSMSEAARTIPELDGGEQRFSGLRSQYAKAVHAACFAGVLARLRQDADGEMIELAALLADLGSLAVWSKAPSSMQQIRKQVAAGADKHRSAQELLGVSLGDLGAGLARAWGLPELVVQGQHLHNSYLPRAQLVLLADQLAEAALRDGYADAFDGLLDLFADYGGCDRDVAQAQLHQAAIDAARICAPGGLPHTAGHLLLISGEAPMAKAKRASVRSPAQRQRRPSAAEVVVAPRTAVAEPEPEPARPAPTAPSDASSPRPAPEPKQAKTRSPDPVASAPQKETVAQVARSRPAAATATPADVAAKTPIATKPVRPAAGTERAAPPEMPAKAPKEQPAQTPAGRETVADGARSPGVAAPASLQDRLQRSLENLCDEGCADRAMLAIYSRDRRSLKGRLVVGADPGEALRSFATDAKQPHLIGLLMRKSQTLWVKPTNRDKYQRFIVGDIGPLFDPEHVFLASLYKHEVPIGFLYAAGDRLERAQFDWFGGQVKHVGEMLVGKS